MLLVALIENRPSFALKKKVTHSNGRTVPSYFVTLHRASICLWQESTADPKNSMDGGHFLRFLGANMEKNVWLLQFLEEKS